MYPDCSSTRSISSGTSSSCAADMSDWITLRNDATAFAGAVPTPAASVRSIASQSDISASSANDISFASVESPIPRRGRFAIRSSDTRVERVVDHLEVRDEILDLRALVEARAADHLVRDALPDEHVLEHAALRVRPVEDGDLAAVVALLDEPRDLGGDVARLGVLVLHLDDAHRIAVAELRPEVLRLALAVVRDDGVRGLEDRVRRAVVLLERDRLRAREVALELEHVADVGASEARRSTGPDRPRRKRSMCFAARSWRNRYCAWFVSWYSSTSR